MAKKFSILIFGTAFALTNFQQALAETLTGTCGSSYEACHYSLDENGKLIIRGNGAVGAYAFRNSFITFGDQIKDVVIKEGITEIKTCAFQSLPNLKSVSMPNTLTTIGGSSFYGLPKLKDVVIPKSVTSIAGYAFAYTRLENVTIEGNNVQFGDAYSIGYGLYWAPMNFKVIPGSETERRLKEVTPSSLLSRASFEAYVPFLRKIYTVEEAYEALGDYNRNKFSVIYR